MTDDKWDDRLRVLFYGHGKEKFKLIRNLVPGALEDAGFKIEWQMAYPVVQGHDVQNVLADEDLHYKSGEYLRQLDTDKLQAVVDGVDSEAPSVQGFGAAVEAGDWMGFTVAAHKIPIPESWNVEVFTTPPVIHEEEWMDDPPKNPDAPFSYDPAQDFYTEPDT